MMLSESNIPYGYCHCGCGQKTKIAKQTNTKYGHVKGKPVRFIPTHYCRTHPSFEDRFWAKVDKSGGEDACWNWTAKKNLQTGYGSIHIGNRKERMSSHRASYIIAYGSIPDELWVLHKCDNRACCNPKHLFLGTVQDNIRDMDEKGRRALGEKAGNSKLTDEKVKHIRHRYSTGDITRRQLAHEMGVAKTTIDKILSNSTWRHV